MVRIEKANPIGFCFGVRRAVEIAEKALTENKKIYSFGPIIHNPLVVEELSGRGLKVISDLNQAAGAKILIRSHGIPPSIRARIKRKKIGLIDATCPFVQRSHRIVDRLKQQGFYIIIAGEAQHPEVTALADAAGKNKIVVLDTKRIKRLNLKNKKVALLAQSTLAKYLFKQIIKSIKNKKPAAFEVYDTICKDVSKRQSEAIRLSKIVDLMLIVGGKISANTKRLVGLCRRQGIKTHHIETQDEIKKKWFSNIESIGVISGSSTPEWVVYDVITRVKEVNEDILDTKCQG